MSLFPFPGWVFQHSKGLAVLKDHLSFPYLPSLVLAVCWADELVKTSISTRKAACIWASAFGFHYWLTLPISGFAVRKGEVDRRTGCHFLYFRCVCREPCYLQTPTGSSLFPAAALISGELIAGAAAPGQWQTPPPSLPLVRGKRLQSQWGTCAYCKPIQMPHRVFAHSPDVFSLTIDPHYRTSLHSNHFSKSAFYARVWNVNSEETFCSYGRRGHPKSYTYNTY